MYIFDLPEEPEYRDYFWRENFLSTDEVERVLELGRTRAWEQATVTDGTTTVDYHGERHSTLCPLTVDEETFWLFDKIGQMAETCNLQKYHFDIRGIFEPLNITRYGQGDFVNWHKDHGAGRVSHRKLTVTIQLTDPAEYDGGDLELLFDEVPVTEFRDRGTAVVFPSFVLHRVSPVTRGTRTSLVAWVGGPPFR